MNSFRLTFNCQYLLDLEKMCQEAAKTRKVTNLRIPARAELFTIPAESSAEKESLFSAVLKRLFTSPTELKFSQTSEAITLTFRWNELFFYLKPLAEKYGITLPPIFTFTFATGAGLDKLDLVPPTLQDLSFRLTMTTPFDVKEFCLQR